jgi:hypothetical protein
MIATLALVLFIVGFICGLIVLARTRLESLEGWGLVAVSGGLILLRLA